MSIQPPEANKFQNVNEILNSANKELKLLEDRVKSKPAEITHEYLKALTDSLNQDVLQWSDLDITKPDDDPDDNVTNILFDRILNIQKAPAIQAQARVVVASEFIAALQQLQNKVKETIIKKQKRRVTKSEKVDTQ